MYGQFTIVEGTRRVKELQLWLSHIGKWLPHAGRRNIDHGDQGIGGKTADLTPRSQKWKIIVFKGYGHTYCQQHY